ncbi:hypothetical protein CHU98_g11192, partial [Xylaria longipes]
SPSRPARPAAGGPRLETQRPRSQVAGARAQDHEGRPASHGRPPADCDRDAFGDTLARRQAAIGPLWFEARDRKGRRKRVIIESLKELPADVSVWDTPGMLTEGTSALLSLSSLPPGTPRRYPIPFFDGEEKEEKEEKKERREATRNAPQPQKMNKYLVFWDGPSSTPDKEQPTLCLGNYLVSSLKVEGDRPKLARLALQNFKLFDDIR